MSIFLDVQLEAVLHLAALIRVYKDREARIAAAGQNSTEMRAFYDKIGAAIAALQGIDEVVVDEDVIFRLMGTDTDDDDVILHPHHMHVPRAVTYKLQPQPDGDDDDDYSDVVIRQ